MKIHKKKSTKQNKTRWRSLLDVTTTTTIKKYKQNTENGKSKAFYLNFLSLSLSLLAFFRFGLHCCYCSCYCRICCFVVCVCVRIFFSSFAHHFFHLFNFYLCTMPSCLFSSSLLLLLDDIHDSCVLLFFCDVPSLYLRVFYICARDDQPQNHLKYEQKWNFCNTNQHNLFQDMPLEEQQYRYYVCHTK